MQDEYIRRTQNVVFYVHLGEIQVDLISALQFVLFQLFSNSW
jgi:hypothetical protein